MDTIRDQYKKKCMDALYSSNWPYTKVFTTTNFVVQATGNFSAKIRKIQNDKIYVSAWNDQGLESLTRIPKPWGETNRNNASIQQMIFDGASWSQYPKSILGP